MSEQKYYVRLKLDGQLLNYGGFYDDELGCDEYDKFTKKELAEIMDGALYRQPFLGETGIQPEWINPLIEIVPVEDNE